MTKIDKTNYHLNSFANFKFKKNFKKNDIKSDGVFNEEKITKLLNKGKQKWNHHYSSDDSIYYTNEDESKLIRISNHWSNYNFKSGEDKGYGEEDRSIRSVFWNLNNVDDNLDLQDGEYNNYMMGEVSFNSMELPKTTKDFGIDDWWDWSKQVKEKEAYFNYQKEFSKKYYSKSGAESSINTINQDLARLIKK